MTPRPLLLLGAGGLAREALAVARTLPERWEVVGMLDDSPARHGARVDGVEVLGPTDLVHETTGPAVVACVASSASPEGRRRLVQRLDLPSDRWATLVHPTAALAPGTVLGPGSLLLAGVVVTAPQSVGAHVVAMPQVVFTHDDVVGDFSTFAARACLAGGVRIGPAAYLGAGALVRENRTIGQGAVVGLGSVVLQDVPERQVWAGVPARRLHDTPVPAGVGRNAR